MTPTTPSESSPNRRALRLIVAALVFIGAATLLLVLGQRILDVFLVLFAGILLGVFFTGTSGWIRQRTPLSHRQALAVVIIVLLALTVLAAWVIVPTVNNQDEQLQDSFEQTLADLESTLSNQGWAQPILNWLPGAEEASASPGILFNRLSMVFSRTMNLFTSAVVVLFVGFYLAAEPDLYANGLLKLAPYPRRRRAGQVLDEIAHTLRWWLVGRLASMLIIGVFWTVGLLLLGIPLAILLGVLGALLTFIPIVGPLLSLIPAALVALTISPTQALYVIALYFVIQVVESYMITPLIQRKAVALPPVLLIMSQLLFGLLFGFLGLLVAAPTAAVLQVLVKMLYVQDVLGDEDVDLILERPQAHFEVSREAAPRQGQTETVRT